MLAPKRFWRMLSRLQKRANSHDAPIMPEVQSHYETILDVFEQIDPRSYS